MASRLIPEGLVDDVRRIMGDLTTLEINTIVTESILGTKMPGIRHALVNIARDYDRQLSLYGMGRPPGEDGTVPPMRGGRSAFDDLHDRSRRLAVWLQQRADAHVRAPDLNPALSSEEQIGRASWRERVAVGTR